MVLTQDASAFGGPFDYFHNTTGTPRVPRKSVMLPLPGGHALGPQLHLHWQ